MDVEDGNIIISLNNTAFKINQRKSNTWGRKDCSFPISRINNTKKSLAGLKGARFKSEERA